MLQLSIVIPALGRLQALEDTLVSVLANRPDDCEVLVVLNDDYVDQYDLSDEVRFIDAPLGADWAQCVNLGISRCRAPLVHLLAPGIEVEDGWTQPALVCFADHKVATVAPLILDQDDSQRALLAGLTYARGGAIGHCGPKQTRSSLLSDKQLPKQSLACSPAAGFYRKSLLDDLGDPFASNLGEVAAAVDLALQLRKLGLRTICQPVSQVRASPDVLATSESQFSHALFAERLFLRHVAVGDWSLALASHALSVAAEFLSSLPLPTCLTQLLGRAGAWFHLAEHRQLLPQLEQLAAELAEAEDDAASGILRMYSRRQTQPARKPQTARDTAAG